MEKKLGIGAMSGCSAMLSGSPARAAAIPSCSYLSSGNGKNGYGQFPWSPLHFSPLPTRPIFVHWNGRGGISINPSQVKGLKCRQRCGVLVKAHLGHVPGPEELESVVRAAFHGSEALFERVEGLLYTLADAAVSTDAVVDTADKAKGDWLTGITNILEAVLKVLKDGLSSVNIPYSYGFAIILLTVLVKAVTLPLTKQQVESSLAMQNLQPKIKAIQQRYAGDQERIQLETARLYKQAGVNPLAGCLPTLATLPVWIGLYRALSNVANEGLLTEGFFWIPSLAGPTTIAARQTGSGISWLFPFVDGHPPLGWADTIAYLVLPVLLVASQYVSMQMMQPKTPDPSQQNSQVILKFLPLMIGYFSLSVPSGLSLYWFTNNLLSTGQQVWLKKLGGAKLPDSSEIIDAGQAKRTTDSKETRGERFRRLKAEETRRKAEAASKKAASQSVAGAAKELEKMSVIEQAEKDKNRDSESEDENGDGNGDDKDEAERPLSTSKGSLEELYANSGNGAAGSDESSPNKNKRSKRKRMA